MMIVTKGYGLGHKIITRGYTATYIAYTCRIKEIVAEIRCLIMTIENRTSTIATESRETVIATESRETVIATESRETVIATEDRTLVMGC